MGGSVSESAKEPMDTVLKAYTDNLPGLMQITQQGISPTAQATLKATQDTQPAYQQLNYDLTKQYAPLLAKVGQEITNSNAQAGSATNLQQLTGTGGDIARAAYQLARDTNPNYYKVQDATSEQAKNLVNSINLRGLSPGEQNAVERSVNQGNAATGNLGNSNAMNTIGNAMNFGNAYQQKIGALGNALGAANGVATSAQNTGFSPINLALGQPNASTMTNFGTGMFNNTNASTQNAAMSTAFNFGSGLLGNLSGISNANQSANAQVSSANSPAAMMSGIGSLAGGVCCFIFLEAYHGKLPRYIRRGRDIYYHRNTDIATGYRRVSCWLVPMMQRFAIMRWLVWTFMVGPISDWLAFRAKHSSVARGKLTTRFWLRVWALLGKGHEESEYHQVWMYPMLKEAK